MNSNPTPHPDVNEIVNLLFTNTQNILQDQLIGMYLHGSLANGGFDTYSDVDVIVVTKNDLSDEIVSMLSAMHKDISTIDSPWANQLEVSYLPKDALRQFDRSNIMHPHLDRGNGEVLHQMAHECDWIIQRHIMRECGITIMGPDPKSLIDPVSPNDMRQAVIEGMDIWLPPVIAGPSEMNTRGYQSFFVLSICRMLYTIKHGEILSKSAAGEWGKKDLDQHWRPLIERALIGRQHPNLEPDPQDIAETVAMMKFALAQIKPTPYPDVNEVLNVLLANVKEILGDQFVGMYLYGSLSSGDFDPESSDIDFLFVTADSLSPETIAKLEAMHQQTWGTSDKRAGKLEGAYVPKDLIRRHNPDGAECPTINEGKFYLDRPGSDWIIQRHVVRECGVIVEGPDPKTLIDFVSPEDIRNAVKGILREWWFPMLDDPSWLRDHDRGYHSFAILSMCRALHALEHGTIVSKPVAAKWAQKKLGAQWSKIIELALIAQKPGAENFELLDDSLNLIRYVKEHTTQ